MSSLKIIKNNTQEEKTWAGHIFAAGETYTIPETSEERWASNSKLLIAISNGEAIVNNGTIDLTDVNKAINYLKGDVPIDVRDTERSQYEKFYGDKVTTLLGESEKAYTITPENGEIITVKEFQVTAPSDPNVVVVLVWDYGGDEEELLFGWANDRFRPTNLSRTGDGNKCMAIVLVNGGIAEGVRLAGYLKYDLE